MKKTSLSSLQEQLQRTPSDLKQMADFYHKSSQKTQNELYRWIVAHMEESTNPDGIFSKEAVLDFLHACGASTAHEVRMHTKKAKLPDGFVFHAENLLRFQDKQGLPPHAHIEGSIIYANGSSEQKKFALSQPLTAQLASARKDGTYETTLLKIFTHLLSLTQIPVLVQQIQEHFHEKIRAITAVKGTLYTYRGYEDPRMDTLKNVLHHRKILELLSKKNNGNRLTFSQLYKYISSPSQASVLHDIRPLTPLTTIEEVPPLTSQETPNHVGYISKEKNDLQERLNILYAHVHNQGGLWNKHQAEIFTQYVPYVKDHFYYAQYFSHFLNYAKENNLPHTFLSIADKAFIGGQAASRVSELEHISHVYEDVWKEDNTLPTTPHELSAIASEGFSAVAAHNWGELPEEKQLQQFLQLLRITAPSGVLYMTYTQPLDEKMIQLLQSLQCTVHTHSLTLQETDAIDTELHQYGTQKLLGKYFISITKPSHSITEEVLQSTFQNAPVWHTSSVASALSENIPEEEIEQLEELLMTIIKAGSLHTSAELLTVLDFFQTAGGISTEVLYEILPLLPKISCSLTDLQRLVSLLLSIPGEKETLHELFFDIYVTNYCSEYKEHVLFLHNMFSFDVAYLPEDIQAILSPTPTVVVTNDVIEEEASPKTDIPPIEEPVATTPSIVLYGIEWNPNTTPINIEIFLTFLEQFLNKSYCVHALGIPLWSRGILDITTRYHHLSKHLGTKNDQDSTPWDIGILFTIMQLYEEHSEFIKMLKREDVQEMLRYQRLEHILSEALPQYHMSVPIALSNFLLQLGRGNIDDIYKKEQTSSGVLSRIIKKETHRKRFLTVPQQSDKDQLCFVYMEDTHFSGEWKTLARPVPAKYINNPAVHKEHGHDIFFPAELFVRLYATPYLDRSPNHTLHIPAAAYSSLQSHHGRQVVLEHILRTYPLFHERMTLEDALRPLRLSLFYYLPLEVLTGFIQTATTMGRGDLAKILHEETFRRVTMPRE